MLDILSSPPSSLPLTVHSRCNAIDSDAPPEVQQTYLSLRVVALFVILVGSTLSALTPVLLVRHAQLEPRSVTRKVPRALLDFSKYFGSGIILGTAFIHLLAPGIEALGSPCLPEEWRRYPYALGFCLCSIFSIFMVEIASVRYGLHRRAQAAAHHTEHRYEILKSHSSLRIRIIAEPLSSTINVIEPFKEACNEEDEVHSDVCVLIGLTLAVDPKFKVLFAVLVTHQIFEGLAIGSRLASVRLPARCAYVPITGAVVFGLSTPLGLAVGLASRARYSADASGARVVSGTLDSLSAGILIYTGLVELLGRDILLNKELMHGPLRSLAAALLCVVSGCCVMAILGKWA
ncbi:ZIP zinc transporter-domain-containing protein [Mycena pura]|uniref:ZIP zinc transporter-domain-containing protein n=1 Tax=Mycena pura TaxID=153505 RepID=A0AAD6VFP1_9AGAR|nr:ZIP zinc transporter-domain-containing protein [Mycena pura]